MCVCTLLLTYIDFSVESFIQNYFANQCLLSSRKRNIIVVEAKPMDYMTLREAGEKWSVSS